MHCSRISVLRAGAATCAGPAYALDSSVGERYMLELKNRLENLRERITVTMVRL